jgi:hypothetical protein
MTGERKGGPSNDNAGEPPTARIGLSRDHIHHRLHPWHFASRSSLPTSPTRLTMSTWRLLLIAAALHAPGRGGFRRAAILTNACGYGRQE